MGILSIKKNSHSFSHLLLKIHKSGQDYCSGDCVTLSPSLLLLGKLSIFVRNILYFFCGQGEIGSAPKSWRQKQKIIFCAMHALYVCVPLAPSEKCTRYCVQLRTG